MAVAPNAPQAIAKTPKAPWMAYGAPVHVFAASVQPADVAAAAEKHHVDSAAGLREPTKTKTNVEEELEMHGEIQKRAACGAYEAYGMCMRAGPSVAGAGAAPFATLAEEGGRSRARSCSG